MYQSYPNYYQPAQVQNRPIMQQPQIPTPQQIQPAFLKGRLVSSIDEVKATPIDFDGSVFYFPDIANKRIYTKQINLDGTASMNMYELKEIPLQQNNINNIYITREEFEKAMSQIQSIINKPQLSNENSIPAMNLPPQIQQTPSQQETGLKF